jgi:hypothetical protein
VPDEAIHPLEGFLFRYILSACTDLPEDYLKREYANFGFSFPYDRDFLYTEEPFPGTQAFSSQSGVVQFSFLGYPVELFTVMWNDAFAGMNAEETLSAAAAILTEDPSLVFIWRESTDISVGDRDIRVEVLDVETEGLYFTAALGVWMCESSDQTYVISFATNHSAEIEDVSARFAELLGSLSCTTSE